MRRAGEREGREKRTTALEAGLKGTGGGAGGGGPWQADNRRERAELGSKEAGGGQTSRPFRQADTKLMQDDNNEGLDNNKASRCWFSILAQTNH